MARPRWAENNAVTSVIGDLLLVAITVGTAVSLSVFVAGFDAPQHDRPASVAISFDAGEGGWGTGDEEIRLDHRGGERLDARVLKLALEIDGVRSGMEPPNTSPFEDGQWSIGERWTITSLLAGGKDVEALLIDNTAGSIAIAMGRFTPSLLNDCSTDTAAPTVSSWVQSPDDLDANDVGSVVVTARLSDDCAGVDTGVVPTLEYRIYDGVDPSFTVLPMAYLSGTEFRATIPEPASGWAAEVLDTLQYKVVGMQDYLGNAGESILRSDVIQIGTSYTYANCPPVFGVGSMSDCFRIQDPDDSFAAGDLYEGIVASSVWTKLYGSLSDVGGATTDEAQAEGPPDADAGSAPINYATLPTRNDWVRVWGFTPPPGAVLGVKIFYEGHQADPADGKQDLIRLGYAKGTQMQSLYHQFNPTIGTDTIEELDITGEETWTRALVEDMRVRAYSIRRDNWDGYQHVDSLWVEVQSDTTTRDLNATFTFTGVPDTAVEEIQFRYKTLVDKFSVQVLGSSGWTTKATGLSSPGSWTTVTLPPLSVDEYNGGSPSVRFVDEDFNPANRGHLLLDYLRVKST